MPVVDLLIEEVHYLAPEMVMQCLKIKTQNIILEVQRTSMLEKDWVGKI